MKKRYRIIIKPKFINYHLVSDNYGNTIMLPFADYTFHKCDKYCSDNSKESQRYSD